MKKLELVIYEVRSEAWNESAKVVRNKNYSAWGAAWQATYGLVYGPIDENVRNKLKLYIVT